MAWDTLPWRRIVFVGSIILMILAIVLLVLRLRRAPAIPPAPLPIQNPPSTTLPTAGQGGVPTTIPGATLTPTQPETGIHSFDFAEEFFYAPNRSGGNLIAFSPQRGAFVQIDNQGHVDPLGEFQFSDVLGVNWSHDRSNALIEQSNGAKTLYNIQTKKQQTLPNQWSDIQFGPNNDSLVFKNTGTTVDGNWLASTNLTNGSLTLLRALGDNADSVEVNPSPDGSISALGAIPTDGTSQDLYFIKKTGELSPAVSIKGGFFQSQWSPNSRWLLFSTADLQKQFKPLLWLGVGGGAKQGQYTPLPLNTTAEQCTFTSRSTSIICSVPDSSSLSGYGISKGSSIPDVPHRVVSLNLTDGSIKTLYTPPTSSVLVKPVVTADDKTLYITNRTTGQLESISLQP